MNEHATESRDGAALGGPRAIRRVWLLSGALIAAAAVALLVAGGPLVSSTDVGWWVVAIVTAGFGLSERFVFHIEYRRNAISFSLSEVPTALALVFLSPVAAIVIRVVISTVVILSRWRMPAYKLCFNGALFAFETALAFAIVRSLSTATSLDSTRGVLVAGAAMILATGLGAVFVSAAIALFDGGLALRLAKELRTCAIVSPLSTMVAIPALIVAMHRVEMVLFVFVPIVAAWFLAHQFGDLAQRHRDLESLHDFVSAVGGTLDPAVLASTALDEAAELLRAGAGRLQIFDLDGAVVARAASGRLADDARDEVGGAVWAAITQQPGAVACRFMPSGALELASEADAEMIAVAVRDGDTVIGTLVLADHLCVDDRFDADDVSRLDKLAALLGAKIRNALLHTDLQHVALHDTLTGQPNRDAFTLLLATARPPAGSTGAVVLVGLDHFKEVNDTLGRSSGDRVLVAAAERIAGLLGPDDVLARVGGDEFAIRTHRPAMQDVEHLAQSVVELSRQPLHVDDIDVVVLASVGVAALDAADRTEPDRALDRAAAAMFTAKRERSGFAVFSEGTAVGSPDWLPLLTGLRAALDSHSIEVHYQPKVDLVTSQVVGAEALVRWNHPHRGFVQPDVFVRIAEESGLIAQLTDQVLHRSVETARAWSDDGYDLGVSVNLSSHDLLDDSLPDRVAALLDRHRFPPERLTLELTETALLSDKPRVTRTIERLAELDVRLSLDDFGTGYSSLGYLRRLPVSELKVDQSFVKNLLLDEQDEVIVRSTIDLGHNLGLQVVAEGLENQPVFERLQVLGCDVGQGYGISRPLPDPLFRTWLESCPFAVRRPSVFTV